MFSFVILHIDMYIYICTPFQSGYCFVDERGIPDGWSSPTDNCQACNSSLDLLQWSPVNTIGEFTNQVQYFLLYELHFRNTLNCFLL